MSNPKELEIRISPNLFNAISDISSFASNLQSLRTSFSSGGGGGLATSASNYGGGGGGGGFLGRLFGFANTFLSLLSIIPNPFSFIARGVSTALDLGMQAFQAFGGVRRDSNTDQSGKA
jgi:hypothetical protein